MQGFGLLSTCLMPMGMKWWTKGSSWWYEPHLDSQTSKLEFVCLCAFLPNARFIFLQLEEIFRKKKDRKEATEDFQRLDQQVSYKKIFKHLYIHCFYLFSYFFLVSEVCSFDLL